MIHLPMPFFDDVDIFKRCAKLHPDITEIDLQNAIPLIQHLYDKYHTLMQNGKVIDIPRSESFGKFTNDLMKSLYSEQLVGKHGACRDEYNRILASAPHKKCPMCSESIVTALDHHVPKQTYFSFSINSKNLVPICSRCNEAKKNTMPDRLDKQFIHPYYDDFSGESWFEMIFLNHDPIEIDFVCNPRMTFSIEVQEKLKSHFSRLKLNELYRSNAIVKLEDMKNNFASSFIVKDWVSVRDEIEYLLRTVQRRPDSWEYALYTRLLQEKWYIEGGFNNID